MDDELLDLVDGNDNVIGTINRKDYQRLVDNKLGYIRASELFIVNDEGRIWIPVRTATKTIAPNGYDCSAAGHVESKDDYLSTIIREAEEEIYLHLTPDDLEFVAKMKSDDVKYFRSIYVLRSNETPAFNTDDFVSAEWLTPDELIENIRNGHPAKINLAETATKLKTYLDTKK